MTKMKYYGGIIKLAALVVLMPIVLGKCTFSKTYQLYKEYRQIQAMEAQLARVPISKPALAPMALENENLVSNGRLVELAGQECERNNITVKQYEPRLLDSEGDYKLYTATLVLSGDYVGLVKTLQYWEDNLQSVKVSSLQFEHDEKKMKEKKVEMGITVVQLQNYTMTGQERKNRK